MLTTINITFKTDDEMPVTRDDLVKWVEACLANGNECVSDMDEDSGLYPTYLAIDEYDVK